MDSVSGGGGGGEGETSASEVNSGGLQRVFYCHQCLRRTFPDAEHIDVNILSYLIPNSSNNQCITFRVAVDSLFHF